MGAGKLGVFVEGARGIDLLGFSLSPVPATFVFGAVAVCRAPLAGGVEVFELGEVVAVCGDLADVEPVAVANAEALGGAGEWAGAFVAVNPVAVVLGLSGEVGPEALAS